MSTSIMIIDDLTNVNIQNLFNINLVYDFETLKMTVQSLIRNQIVLTNRLIDLENSSADKQVKVEIVDIKIDTIKDENHEIADHISQKDDNFRVHYEKKKKELEEREMERIRNISVPRTILQLNKQNDNKIENTFNFNYNKTVNEKSYENTTKDKIITNGNYFEGDSWIINVTDPPVLAKKLALMDKDIREIKFTLKNANKFTDNDEKFEDINVLNKRLLTLQDRVNKLEKLNEERDEIELFNQLKGGKIGDLGNNEGDESLNIFISKFEKKAFKKLELIDENIKKAEEDRFKIKSELLSLKSVIDSYNKSINTDKEELVTKVEKLATDTKNNLDNLEKSLKEEIEAKFKYTKNQIKSTFPDIKGNHSDNNDEENGDDMDNMNEEEKNMSNLPIIKRVQLLEQSFKSLNSKVNMEQINKELFNIYYLLNEKAPKIEYLQLKDQLIDQETRINFLKENLSNLNEDRIIFDEFNNIKKKIQILTNSANTDDYDISKFHIKSMENNKFVDLNFFNEFSHKLKIELDETNLKVKENNKVIDEIAEFVKKLPTTNDLKSLEDYFVSKLDEIKVITVKKFADKTEVSKNIRYLDTQIKHIMEMFSKKNDKGDNWLIAKKPINGYTCASCEQYLGDLHDNNQFVPWNKIPNQNEKLYRVGSGFSKMLQMLNVDGDKNDELNSSKYKNSTRLPRVSSVIKFKVENNHEGSLDMDSDNKEESPQNLDPNRAKVVKIFKKKKKDEIK